MARTGLSAYDLDNSATRALRAREPGGEPVERLFGAADTFEAIELRGGRLTGPELGAEEKPPTKRQLSRFLPMETDEELRGSFGRIAGAADLTVLAVDAYGAPSYGPLAKPEGLVYHTPENVDHTVAQAIAIARWQASPSNTSGGSYMGILGYNGTKPMSDPLGWTMVRCVPWNVAAGGLSTRRDEVWSPDRYPWIKQMLSAGAYADPNRYLQQIAVSGKAAWWSSKLSTSAGRAEVRGALIALARWLRVLEKAYSYDAVLTLHRHWQMNRTDPAGLDFAELVLGEYALLDAPEPEPEPEPTPAGTFPDVLPTHPMYEAIEWMHANGITKGGAGGLFYPDRALTRAEAAAFLYRFSKLG